MDNILFKLWRAGRDLLLDFVWLCSATHYKDISPFAQVSLVRSPCICLSSASPQDEPAAPSRPQSVRLHLSDRRRGPSLEWHFNKPVWTSEDSNQSPTKGGNLSLSSFSVTQTTHTSARTRGGRAHQRGRDTKAAAASLTPVSKYITRRRHFMLHNLQENCVCL